jgi:hypothetical protein
MSQSVELVSVQRAMCVQGQRKGTLLLLSVAAGPMFVVVAGVCVGYCRWQCCWGGHMLCTSPISTSEGVCVGGGNVPGTWYAAGLVCKLRPPLL